MFTRRASRCFDSRSWGNPARTRASSTSPSQAEAPSKALHAGDPRLARANKAAIRLGQNQPKPDKTAHLNASCMPVRLAAEGDPLQAKLGNQLSTSILPGRPMPSQLTDKSDQGLLASLFTRTRSLRNAYLHALVENQAPRPRCISVQPSPTALQPCFRINHHCCRTHFRCTSLDR